MTVAPGRGVARGLLAAPALAALGAALALLPHADALARTGDWSYVADGDQLLYMAWSRGAVLRGEPRLVDAVHPRGGPMMHPWAVFVPPALIAHALGTDTRGLAAVWRALGGAGVALGLYAAARAFARDGRVALGLAAFLLCDAGLTFGQPLTRELDVLRRVATGDRGYFEGVPMVAAHLRVVPPALAYPFLLAHYALALRARATGSKRAAAGAAGSFGLLFYIYFYFWTATAAGLALAALLDPKGRRLYLGVLAAGVVIGVPSLLASSAAKASTPPDWLLRTDKFVPIGRFDELLVPKAPAALWLLSAPWVFARRRELAYLWCCAGGALACLNHQVVTRLQIENFHWMMAVGPPLCLLLAGLLTPWFRGRGRLALLGAVVAAQVGLGFGLRWLEATRTAETAFWADVYERLTTDNVLAAIPPGAVLAGDPTAIQFCAALAEVYPLSGRLAEFCSGVTDAELDERLMLNLFLSGLDRGEARGEATRPPGVLGWEAAATRSDRLAREQRERRLALVDAIWSDPSPAAARLGPTHILLPAGAEHPEAALKALGPSRRLASGGSWQVWEMKGAYRGKP